MKNLLRGMDDGRIRCVAVDTPVPSQFSHEILNANPYAYLDDAPLEERRARAVEMRRILPESVLEEVGKLDPAAIAQVREEAWPDVRDADELHDVLHTLIAVPGGGDAHSAVATARLSPGDSAVGWVLRNGLLQEHRAASAIEQRYGATGSRPSGRRYFRLLFPDASFDRAPWSKSKAHFPLAMMQCWRSSPAG